MGWHIAQYQNDFLEAQAFHSTPSTYTHNNNQNIIDEQKPSIFLNTKASLFKLWTQILVL